MIKRSKYLSQGLWTDEGWDQFEATQNILRHSKPAVMRRLTTPQVTHTFGLLIPRSCRHVPAKLACVELCHFSPFEVKINAVPGINGQSSMWARPLILSLVDASIPFF
jgi:hypothetical protein